MRAPRLFALDIANNFELDDDPEYLKARILVIDRDHWDKYYPTAERQARANRLPLTALSSPTDFFNWRDSAAERITDGGKVQFLDRVTRLYRDRLSTIHRYSFPAVTLEGAPPVAAIARIFEKVNRSGTQLGTFDLMVARLYQPDWNLRDRWNDLRESDPAINYLLENDGLPILEAIALRHEHDVRRSVILDLRPDLVRTEWDRFIIRARDAVTALATTYGVRNPDWLPYGVMLVGLISLVVSGTDPSSAVVKSWFWDRAFGLGYDAAANTRIVADYSLLATGSIVPRGSYTRASESPLYLRAIGMLFVAPRHRRRLANGGLPLLVRVLRDEVDEASLDAALSSQLLPTSAEVLSLEDDWNALLEARLHLIVWVSWPSHSALRQHRTCPLATNGIGFVKLTPPTAPLRLGPIRTDLRGCRLVFVYAPVGKPASAPTKGAIDKN